MGVGKSFSGTNFLPTEYLTVYSSVNIFHAKKMY